MDYTSPMPPIAWQAILDANGALVGHEIFNRSRTASAHTMDSDLALAHAVLSHIQPTPLPGDGLLFLNTTYESLHGVHLDLLPASRVVLEIPSLGHAASSEVTGRRPALAAMRAKGFALAFDHSVLDSAYAPWHDLVDYVKIDFSVLTAERAVLVIRWARRLAGAILIADKIESPAQLQLAQGSAVDLLQDYAVSRPQPVRARVLLPTDTAVAGLAAVLRGPLDTHAVAHHLQTQPTLLFNLLRMARSQGVERTTPYASVVQLVDALGARCLRAWATLLQAVAAQAPRDLSYKQRYIAHGADLAMAAQTAWPDVAVATLQLVAHALLVGQLLGLSVAQSADQLLPAPLTQQVLAVEPQWRSLLGALAPTVL